jgi:hypothetical protein
MRFSRFAVILVAAAAVCGVMAEAASQQGSTPGVACVALTVPSIQGVEGDATRFGVAVRDLFASYLTGPSIRTVPLQSRLGSQAALEAREKDCGYVLLVTVARQRSGGSKVARMLGQAAGTAMWRAPLGGGVTGAVATGAVAGGEALHSFASEIRAKDELEVSYRLGAPDAVEHAPPVTSRAKAKSDGEDLLTPLVETAANGIVTAATAGGR